MISLNQPSGGSMASSAGGNGAADAGKVPLFGAAGGLIATNSLSVLTDGTTYPATDLTASGITFSPSVSRTGTLAYATLTANRTWTLPDKTGTVAMTSDIAITGGGTLATGGFTLTVPATGTAALLGTANVFTALQTVTLGSANVGALASTGYSLTGSNATSMIDLAGTWNTSGTPIALKLNITNTSSNASSMLMELQTGGTPRLQVVAATSPTYQRMSLDGGLGFTGNGTAYNGIALANGGWNGISIFSVGIACLNVGYWSSIPRVTMPSNTQFAWSDGTVINGASGATDLLLVRKAAATLQLGADAAGVTNQMFTAASRITSDGVGANLTIAGGNGRGGAGGSLTLSTYDTGAAATIGTLRSRLVIDTTGAFSFPVTTAVTTETVVSDTTWPISINGVTYKVCLKS